MVTKTLHKGFFPLALQLLLLSSFLGAQSFSSAVYIWTVYSENGEYFLRSTPWDNESPSTRGTTSVFKKGIEEPVYHFAVGFDEANDNKLVLSNSGDIILYVIPWGAKETIEGLKSVTIYRRGKIAAGFTESELTGCDGTKERCSLLYSNYDQVVDEEKSRAAGKTVFKEGVSTRDRFLNQHPIVVVGDTVYLIDPKQNVHRFDLQTGTYTGKVKLDSIFGELQSQFYQVKVESERHEAPSSADFLSLRSGKDSRKVLATTIGMKEHDDRSTKDEQYKRYTFKISGYIRQDGVFEIDDLKLFDDLPQAKITAFFSENRFINGSVPKVFEKWHVRDKYFSFRKANDALARQERRAELKEQQENLKKQLVSETIDGRYIPSNLPDSLAELDKIMPDVNKNEIRELKSRDEMIQYHHGLGTWLRNSWGLWGGSRLQKYFTDRGIDHPDEMSGVILDHYFDWLHGDKASWKLWEASHPEGNK